MQPNFSQFKQAPNSQNIELEKRPEQEVFDLVSRDKNREMYGYSDEPTDKDNGRNEQMDPEKDKVYVYDVRIFSGEQKETAYYLTTDIAGIEYVFRLVSSAMWGGHSLSFKTSKYDYATTNLDQKGTEELFAKLAKFLETVHVADKKVDEFSFSSHAASYSAQEIDDCAEQIAANSDKYTKEQILQKYKGQDVFILYLKVTGKEYKLKNDRKVYIWARTRYFRIYFKKYLKNWEVVERLDDGKSGFHMKRKIDTE